MRSFSFSFFALGGPNDLQIFGETEEQVSVWAERAIAEVRRIEFKYSRYREDSILSSINCASGRHSVQVDGETAALLDYAHACYLQSEGRFDITSGVLRRVWNFKSGVPPSHAEVQNILPLIGWDTVEWNRPDLFLPLPGMEIDFGGIGKEYAVDRVAALLQELGASAALVNFGGDVRAMGNRPDGNSWNIGIVHPRRSGDVIATLELTQAALATSGDYERFMEHAGQRYGHILHPRTGFPVGEFQSVTVFAPSCLVAGTVATSTMLCTWKQGLAYLRGLGLHFLCMSQVGEVLQG